MNQWLNRHPLFGPSLVAWREEGAVPVRAKVIASLLLLLSWSLLLWFQVAALVLWLTGLLYSG